MKTLKLGLLLALPFLFGSCIIEGNFGQISGNGNVTTEDRNLESDFTKVRGTSGLDVYLVEGSSNSVRVEADENLQEIIETEVVNGMLKVSTSKNIGHSKSKKVYITYVSLDEIQSSSGADVIVNSIVSSENLTLDASSGSDLRVEVFAKQLYIDCSSGADIKVSGRASKLIADASSGSDIDARNLETIDCSLEVSSGADITVNVKERLNVDASSGGDVRYYGNPTAVSTNDSKSASVRKM